MNKISKLDKNLQEIEIREFIQDLRNLHVNVRLKAHKELVRIGDNAIPHIISLMHEGNRHLLREAVQMLGEMTSPKSPRSLVVSLRDDDPLVRWDATKALVNLERGGLLALFETLVENYKSIRLRNASRDILRMLAQNQHLTSDEERVLSILEGSYPDAEAAHAAQAVLEVLKQNNYPMTGDEALPAAQ
jgi:HEAT repeat protein